MGGSITVAIRRLDGMIEAVEGWTNSMGWFLFRHRLGSNTEEVMDHEYLRHYRQETELEMLAKAGQRIGTECAPTGYGLVLVDAITKTVFSMQGYTGCWGMFGTGIVNDLRGIVSPSPGPAVTALMEAYAEGIVPTIRRRRMDGSECAEATAPPTWEEFKVLLEGAEKRDDDLTFSDVHIPNGMSYENFDERTGAPSFLARLKELDFNLTERDLEAWAAWIEEQAEWIEGRSEEE